jgi:hypothetical protein
MWLVNVLMLTANAMLPRLAVQRSLCVWCFARACFTILCLTKLINMLNILPAQSAVNMHGSALAHAQPADLHVQCSAVIVCHSFGIVDQLPEDKLIRHAPECWQASLAPQFCFCFISFFCLVDVTPHICSNLFSCAATQAGMEQGCVCRSFLLCICPSTGGLLFWQQGCWPAHPIHVELMSCL